MNGKKSNFNVIAGIGKQLAGFRFRQEDVLDYMKQSYNDNTASRKLAILSRQSGINQRYSVVPDFNIGCENPGLFDRKAKPLLEKRMEVYKNSALSMAIAAVDNAFSKLQGKLEPKQVTHVLTVSCTGLYAPGLSTQLIEHYNLPETTFHTGINFMGCNASFPALRLADLIVKADQDAVVIIVCVEICTIHFQPKDNDDNLLANTIFSDGAAAMVITSGESARMRGFTGIEILGFSSLTLNKGKSLMAWDVNSINFEMVLSPDIPGFIGGNVKYLSEKLTAEFGLDNLQNVKWAIHPGGKRILDEFVYQMGIQKEDISESYKILSEFGNMSSVTIIFVLDEILSNNGFTGPLIEVGFGPGISIESAFLFVRSSKKKH